MIDGLNFLVSALQITVAFLEGGLPALHPRFGLFALGDVPEGCQAGRGALPHGLDRPDFHDHPVAGRRIR